MRFLILLTSLLIGLAGCAGPGAMLRQPPTPSTTPPPTPVKATAQISATRPCSPAAIMNTLLDFTAAYNQGEVEQVMSFIGLPFSLLSDKQFQTVIHAGAGGVLNVPPYGGPTPFDRIEAYVRHRMAKKDHLTLRVVQIEIKQAWPEHADVQFYLSRRAEDSGAEPTLHGGMGSIKCAVDEHRRTVVDRKITLWALGLPSTGIEHLCSTAIKPAPLTEPVSQVTYCVKE